MKIVLTNIEVTLKILGIPKNILDRFCIIPT